MTCSSGGMTCSSPDPNAFAGNPVLNWLERALQAERLSMNLALTTRHAELLKSMAHQLDGWRNSVPPCERVILAYDPEETSCWLVPQTATVEDDDHEDGSHAKLEDNIVQHKDTRRDTPCEITTRKKWVKSLLADSKFEFAVGFIIVVNSICIGAEASFDLAGKDTTVFDVFEHMFLIVYTAELALQFFAFGLGALKSPWVFFDFVLVAMGILSLYVVGPIVSHTQNTAGDNSVKDSMAGLMVLRMLRLFRLARVVRLLVIFKTLWMLIRGLIGSAGTISYTFCLISLILYIFSCMSIELVTKRLQNSENEEVQTLVEDRFRDLFITMLSLVQFATMDSLSSLYFPLVAEDPVLILLFLPFILIVSISLMNLVTAVIVEGAIEQGKHDRESLVRYKQYNFKKMLPTLKDMFKKMDKDGDGTLTLRELERAPKKIKEDLEQYLQQSDSLTELFEMIDVDESGEVDIDEFCDGIAKLVNSEAPIELVRILKQLKVLRRDVTELKGGGSLTRQSSMAMSMRSIKPRRASKERMMLPEAELPPSPPQLPNEVPLPHHRR